MSRTASQPTTDAPAAADGARFVLEDVTEQTLRFEAVGSRQIAMQVGDAGTFYNEIYDADDTVVGRTVGITVAARRDPGTGRLVNEYKEAIHLAVGTVATVATVDREALMSGALVTFEAVGIGGEIDGLRGVRECRLLPPYPPRPDNRVTTRIVLS